MSEIPTNEPKQATASDTLVWQRSLPDYLPSDGWALSYALRGPDSLDISATPSGDVTGANYSVCAAAPSKDGQYFLQGYVTKGSERHTVYSGTLTLSIDLSAVTGTFDGRSPAKKILDAIDALVAGRASRSDLEYEIEFGGTRRRLKNVPIESLTSVRGIYAQKVWREQNPGKIGPAVNVTFRRDYP